MVTTGAETKKRTIKACDRCRLKKVKCDGLPLCGRCRADDTICQFNVKSNGDGRSVSAAHVYQLQAHNDLLSKALRSIWIKYGAPSHRNGGKKSWTVHDIVRQSGVLDDGTLAHIPSQELFFDEPSDASGSTDEESEPTPEMHDLEPGIDMEYECDQFFAPDWTFGQTHTIIDETGQSGRVPMHSTEMYSPQNLEYLHQLACHDAAVMEHATLFQHNPALSGKGYSRLDKIATTQRPIQTVDMASLRYDCAGCIH